MKEVKPEKSAIKPNFIDRVVSYFDPIRGARRARGRAYANLLELTSTRPDHSRKGIDGWTVSDGDADTDLSKDLVAQREESRGLVRENPLAAGVINTKCTNVVGTGLRLNAQVDREILGLTDEQARAWESHTEAEWRLFSESIDCDAAGVQPFTGGLQDLAYRSSKENGDVLILTPMAEKGYPYRLQLQLIEADRLCNENDEDDTLTLVQGVEKDPDTGAPKRYHIRTIHPGADNATAGKWVKVDAYGQKTRRRNVIHLYFKRRVGQSRGVPDFAPVIGLIKLLGMFTEAEVKTAVIQSFFTVFFKSEDPGLGAGLKPMQPTSTIGGKTSDKDYKLGSGAMLDLKPGEDLIFADPSRPNSSFDPFFLAVTRQIGVALELPFEILVKHFTASYSAARAAIEEAWRYYLRERKWLADMLCKPVYELFMDEAVATGRIVAPGYLTGDPLIRAAWLGSLWTGTYKTQIDETKAVEAAVTRVENGFSTRAEATAELTGGDWEKKHHQRVTEEKLRKEGGLVAEPAPANPKGEDNENLVSDTGEEPDKS